MGRFQQVMYITQILSFYSYVFGLCRNASNNQNDGLSIRVDGDGTNAEVNVKGIVTANSNGFAGMYTSQNPNANLEINVESGSTLNSCGNTLNDIVSDVDTSATVEFLGTGYACDQTKVVFTGAGTVDPPTCQACP